MLIDALFLPSHSSMMQFDDLFRNLIALSFKCRLNVKYVLFFSFQGAILSKNGILLALLCVALYRGNG